ncbi:Dedicator of cytokinesis protein 4 [Pteropus alecto]|uniref:Dedicator of cytokinesis protein 4 n=1 Tax=Pteropus alecto TaxID=9402 RepID=L5KPV4_PTEAL|nr:Dedicator of cytokinesis protein 4 [Pteropus alecto]
MAETMFSDCGHLRELDALVVKIFLEREMCRLCLTEVKTKVSHKVCLPLAKWEAMFVQVATSWYRGFALKNPNIKGIFPSSYIHLKNAFVKNKGQFEMVIPTEDSVITEMTSTLRDWGTMWKQLYVRNEGDLFHRLWHIMNEVLDLRRQVLLGHLTHDRTKDVKRHITARLDWGNEQLGLDLVPRKEYVVVDPEDVSITELYRLMEHRHRKKDTPVQASSHHLFVQMKSLMCSNLGEELEVIFSLFDSKENRPIRSILPNVSGCCSYLNVTLPRTVASCPHSRSTRVCGVGVNASRTGPIRGPEVEPAADGKGVQDRREESALKERKDGEMGVKC